MALSVDTRQALDRHLRDLRLPTMRTSYEALARQAEQETLSYERYLLELTQRECQERSSRRIDRHLHDSELPLEKDLASFDLKRLPAYIARRVRPLLEGSFALLPREPADLWYAWSGQITPFVRLGSGVGPLGSQSIVQHMRLVGPETVDRQTRLKLSRVLKTLASAKQY